jgi:hypothetical protein
LGTGEAPAVRSSATVAQDAGIAAAATHMTISVIPPPHAHRILTKHGGLVLNSLILVVLVALFGGLGLIAIGAQRMSEAAGGTSAGMPQPVAIALCVVGSVMFVGASIMGLVDVTYLQNLYVRAKLRRMFAKRVGPYVRAGDREAHLIEVVPLENIGRFMLETATDLGYLKVDRAQGAVMFEGDKERYHIPTNSIVSVEGKLFVQQQQQTVSQYYYVHLRARHRDGVWEAALALRQGSAGPIGRDRRRRRFEAFLDEIQSVAPSSRF